MRFNMCAGVELNCSLRHPLQAEIWDRDTRTSGGPAGGYWPKEAHFEPDSGGDLRGNWIEYYGHGMPNLPGRLRGWRQSPGIAEM